MKTALAATAAALTLIAAPSAFAQDGSRMMAQMEKADANRDGAVSKQELLSYRATQFDRLDRDGNGVIDDADMPRMARVAEMIKQRTAAMDADGNGSITRAEFNNGPTTGFDMADTNGDGVVTKAEMQAARAKLDQMRQNR